MSVSSRVWKEETTTLIRPGPISDGPAVQSKTAAEHTVGVLAGVSAVIRYILK